MDAAVAAHSSAGFWEAQAVATPLLAPRAHGRAPLRDRGCGCARGRAHNPAHARGRARDPSPGPPCRCEFTQCHRHATQLRGRHA